MSKGKSEQEEIKIQMKFKSFRTLDFAYHQPPEQIKNTDTVHFNFNFEVLIEKSLKSVIINFKVVTFIGKDEGRFQIASIETKSVFEFQGLEPLAQVGDSIQFPDNLLITFLSISYSTTRGALCSKGAGTILETAIMPLIDPKSYKPILDQIKGTDSESPVK